MDKKRCNALMDNKRCNALMDKKLRGGKTRLVPIVVVVISIQGSQSEKTPWPFVTLGRFLD